LVVALVGGVAWAESQSVAVPSGSDVTVVAVLTPGPGGGFVYADDKGVDDVQFSTGGVIIVNGEICTGNNPNHTYEVTLRYHYRGGQWLLDITVRNDTLSTVVYMDADEPIDVKAAMVTAEGDFVHSLSAE
jgi:hypothetical protein